MTLEQRLTHLAEIVASAINKINTALGQRGAQTGDFKPAYRKTEPDGWIYADGRSIGPVSSGADRESADYEALFSHLFEEFDDTEHPLSANNRAYYADAAAAWADGVYLSLPDTRGRILVGQDNMGGTAANRVTVAGSGINGTQVGASGGAEVHTLTEAEMPSHRHPVQSVGGSSGSGSGLVRNNSGNAESEVAGYSIFVGGGESHNNMPPAMVFPLFIKL